MYTFGWIASVSYQFQGELFNSQFLTSTVGFTLFHNDSMDYYSNKILYATTATDAQNAGIKVGLIAMQQMPYDMFFFQNTLFAAYVNGWTGYANIPTYGPGTVGGIYYTLLNIHSTTNSTGGNLNYALHQAADAGGMNPLYNTNWVWQVDIWGEVYDTPLATPPTMFTTVNSFMNYMTTGVHGYSAVPFSGLVPGGATNFQTSSHSRQKIVGGTLVTFNFAKNITWSDGTTFTAKDYLESLIAWDPAVNYNTPDLVTPSTAVLTGPSGLIAAKLAGTYGIKIYVNSSSVWNLGSVIVPVMPQHILQYFNLNHISTAVTDADLTMPFLSQTAYTTYGAPHAPAWMTYEPNMEVGSGPFLLTAFSGSSGDGILTANPNYFRTAWYAGMPSLSIGATYTYNFNIREFIYNPTSSTYCGVGSLSTGYCGIVGPSVPHVSSVKLSKVVSLYSCLTTDPNTGAIGNCKLVHIAHVPKTYNIVQVASTSHYTVSIPTTGMPAGNYEVVLTTHFSFQGLQRTWFQATGFNLH